MVLTQGTLTPSTFSVSSLLPPIQNIPQTYQINFSHHPLLDQHLEHWKGHKRHL